MLKRRTKALLAVLALAIAGAAAVWALVLRDRGSCNQLRHVFKSWGEKLSDRECRRELADLAPLVKAHGSDLEGFAEDVLAQRTWTLLQIRNGLRNVDPASPLPSFPRFPTKVPCVEGVQFGDADWAKSPLAPFVLPKPEKLYFSFELTSRPRHGSEPGDFVRIRSYQDLNCDGKMAVTEMAGYVRRGVPLAESFKETESKVASRLAE